jgi:hypothetical protein
MTVKAPEYTFVHPSGYKSLRYGSVVAVLWGNHDGPHLYNVLPWLREDLAKDKKALVFQVRLPDGYSITQGFKLQPPDPGGGSPGRGVDGGDPGVAPHDS